MRSSRGVIDGGRLRPHQLSGWQEGVRGVELLLPRFGHGRFGRAMDRWFRLRPLPVRLDELGTFVWRRIDGRQTVDEIADQMRGTLGSRADPVAERLTIFLRRLERGRFITYAG